MRPAALLESEVAVLEDPWQEVKLSVQGAVHADKPNNRAAHIIACHRLGYDLGTPS
jgi:hypothetical protein